ncbi:MAG: LPS translocon maturation chaperone LptM [Alphaproteobacteria bacterium]
MIDYVLRTWRGPLGRVLFVLVILALAAPLAACGKKAPPEPPSGKESTYPKTYPSR